jgi:hypothetical protein
LCTRHHTGRLSKQTRDCMSDRRSATEELLVSAVKSTTKPIRRALFPPPPRHIKTWWDMVYGGASVRLSGCHCCITRIRVLGGVGGRLWNDPDPPPHSTSCFSHYNCLWSIWPLHIHTHSLSLTYTHTHKVLTAKIDKPACLHHTRFTMQLLVQRLALPFRILSLTTCPIGTPCPFRALLE